MQKHSFSAGLLIELTPHEHPGLFGLNVNGGQEIKFRIRTDRYGGFRHYNDVRNVLCHERARNVWGNRDENNLAALELLEHIPLPHQLIHMEYTRHPNKKLKWRYGFMSLAGIPRLPLEEIREMTCVRGCWK